MSKDLVKLIKKIAEELDDAPGVPSSGAPRAPIHRAPVSNPAIIQMQTAIQKLATDISSTINYDSIMKAMQEPQNADKKEFTKNYSRDSFVNFMVNSFIRTSDVKGVEYDMDPAKFKMMQKLPSELRQMMAILDSLQRIGKGAAQKERFADGAWGPRTNNALRNVAAIADSIMRLGKQLEMQSQAFDLNKLNELKGLVPEKDTDISLQEKVARAPKITEILNGTIALFKDFQSQVFNNPNFSNILNGERPVFSFGREKQVDAQGVEAKILKSIKENPNSDYIRGNDAAFTINLPKEYLPGQQTQAVRMTAANLLNKQAFEAWADANPTLKSLRQTNPATWSALVPKILQEVKIAVNAKFNAKPQTPAQPSAAQGKTT